MGEFTSLAELVTVNGRDWPRLLLNENGRVEKLMLQGTEIAVAMARYLPYSAMTLTELDVRYKFVWLRKIYLPYPS